LIKFNKFLQENESKRNRAEKRAMEKTRQRKAKEATIVTLKKNLATMQTVSWIQIYILLSKEHAYMHIVMMNTFVW
jgi:hypothetical protein